MAKAAVSTTGKSWMTAWCMCPRGMLACLIASHGLGCLCNVRVLWCLHQQEDQEAADCVTKGPPSTA